MTYQDKQITCVDCGNPFTFTQREQEFFASKGYTNEPKRCLSCRQNRKSQRGGTDGRNAGPRQMFTATCARCGKDCEVPPGKTGLLQRVLQRNESHQLKQL